MIKAILWDIGGVLLTDPAVHDFWKDTKESKELRTSFGEGKLSIEEFVNKGAHLLQVTPDYFKTEYQKIYCSVKEMSASNIIGSIKTPQYILSDTNPIHGTFIQKEYEPLLSKFVKTYMSYEIGMRKNSSKVFEYVAKDINIAPEHILFIDNKKELLEYAKKANFQTHLFENTNKLKNWLTKKNVLIK